MEKSIFKNIEESFIRANKGLETINILIYRWGICGYLLSYFVINKLIFFANIKTIDVFLALIISNLQNKYLQKKCSFDQKSQCLAGTKFLKWGHQY